MTNPLKALCEEVEEAIAALDGSEWATSSISDPTWRPSKQHLDAVGSSLDQHLLFSVSVEGAPVGPLSNFDLYQVVADLTVKFFFKCGAGEKLSRERLAMGAAHQVVATLLQHSFATTVNIDVVQAFQPGAEVGDFLPIELRFAALVDMTY